MLGDSLVFGHLSSAARDKTPHFSSIAGEIPLAFPYAGILSDSMTSGGRELGEQR